MKILQVVTLTLAFIVTLSSCANTGGVAASIKSAADTSKTASQVAENLLKRDIISIEDAESVHMTIDLEVLPRIRAAEKAYAEYLMQSEVHGIDTGGDKTAAEYINFAADYLSGVCYQLKLEFCQKK